MTALQQKICERNLCGRKKDRVVGNPELASPRCIGTNLQPFKDVQYESLSSQSVIEYGANTKE
jgi:hypothetical protein